MSQKIDADKNWKNRCGEEFINKKIGSKDEFKKDVRKKIFDELVINHGTRYDCYSGIYGKEINDFITDSKGSCCKNEGAGNCFYCAFYADMEGFKAFNDYLSEKLGDYIIIFVANALNKSEELQDFVITRSGGDEFNGYMISSECLYVTDKKYVNSDLKESQEAKSTDFLKVFNNLLYEELKVRFPQMEFKIHYFKGKSNAFKLEEPSHVLSLTEEEKNNKRFHVEFKGLKLRYGYTESQDASREAWKVASEYKNYKKSVSAEIVDFISKQYDTILEEIRKKKIGSSTIDNYVVDSLVSNALRDLGKDSENSLCALKLKRIFRDLSMIVVDVPEEDNDKLKDKCAEYKEIFLKRYDLARGEFIHSVKVRCGVREKVCVNKVCSTCYQRTICDVCDDWISLNSNIVFVVVEEKDWELSVSLKDFFDSKNQKYTTYLQDDPERVITAFRVQIPSDKGRSAFLKEQCSEIFDAINANDIEAKDTSVTKTKMQESIFTLSNFSIQDLKTSGKSKTEDIIRKTLESALESTTIS